MVATPTLNVGLQRPGAPAGAAGFSIDVLPRRLERLPLVRIDGVRVRLATTRGARLVGLAFADREHAGPGLLIPSCRSIHTFGMRFPLDVAFLDAAGAVISRRAGVGPRRVVFDRRASAVLELPAGEGASNRPPGLKVP